MNPNQPAAPATPPQQPMEAGQIPQYQMPAAAVPPQPVVPPPTVIQPTMQPVQPTVQAPAPAPAPVGGMIGGPMETPASGQAPQLAQPKTNPNSTQNSLLISEIRDGIVIMNDGSYRAVIMTKSINFDLMSPQEREAVESGFQAFLNSLYFDIQISIRSTKIDIRPYLDRLGKLRNEQDNMLLSLLMDDYIAYITQLATEANIMDKRFYVIVPYFPNLSKEAALGASKRMVGGLFKKKNQTIVIDEDDLEQAKTEMRNRVQAIMNGLMQMGMQALPLDTQELIELYYDAYNPDTASRQQMQPLSDLEAPVVTKGAGEAPNPNLDRIGS